MDRSMKDAFARGFSAIRGDELTEGHQSPITRDLVSRTIVFREALNGEA